MTHRTALLTAIFDAGTADTWFKRWTTKIFNGQDWRSGWLAVVLPADEDDKSAGNNVLTVVIHPSQNRKGSPRHRRTTR